MYMYMYNIYIFSLGGGRNHYGVHYEQQHLHLDFFQNIVYTMKFMQMVRDTEKNLFLITFF
jgi:hypothetical protein